MKVLFVPVADRPQFRYQPLEVAVKTDAKQQHDYPEIGQIRERASAGFAEHRPPGIGELEKQADAEIAYNTGNA
jgi:hypothetical protein